MPNIENFVVNTFRAPRPADVDRDKYSNALLRNEAQRIPQANQAQDLGLKAADQAINQRGTDHARKIAADMFTAIGENPNMAATIVRTPLFQQVGKEIGLPVEQFNPQPGDDLNEIAQKARGWAQAVGAYSNGASQAKPSALVEQYGVYQAQGGKLPFVDPTNKGNDFVTQFSRSQVGAQYGAPVNQPGLGVVQPSRIDPSQNVVLTPEADVSSSAADRAGAEAWAKAAAAAGVDLQNDQRAKQGTLGVWRVAREGLMSALGGTITGPAAGRIPAVTAPQQTAEGAVAAVAPVLKQLFRSAGEGVFTDRDQQLLIDMIPNRRDLPDAITSKMQMIDAIIEAKLNSQQQQGLPPIIPNSSAAQSGVAPEGTVITNQQGQTLVKRNGQWVPQ